MSKAHRFTESQLAAIHEHNAAMIEACENALLRFRQIPKPQRDESIIKQIVYWQNARSAYIWSDGIAKQRKERPSDVNRSAV